MNKSLQNGLRSNYRCRSITHTHLQADENERISGTIFKVSNFDIKEIGRENFKQLANYLTWICSLNVNKIN